MDSDESDNYEHLYEDEDNFRHQKLVQSVLSLNKTQHLGKPSRSEPTLQVSEFNLVKAVPVSGDLIKITDLTKSLNNKDSRVKIKHRVSQVQKSSRTLPKPLEKPQANRIQRGVAYEKARLKLDKWEATVTSNRVSANLRFPLESSVKMNKKEEDNIVSMWRSKSKLEEELEKVEPKVEECVMDLVEENFPLTMKEMLARRKEAAKLRAFQGYREAKARRQNKIKSKKYHRMFKRGKIKQQIKEFEQLQKTDPDLALSKLEEIEKTRVQERFSLRHRSTGKWAKNHQIRAKYDKESRQLLGEQLKLSRDLTQKPQHDSESEEDKNPVEIAHFNQNNDNPWTNGMKLDKEVTDFVSGYRKYWTEKNKSDQGLENVSDPDTTISEEVEKVTPIKRPRVEQPENVQKEVKKKSVSAAQTTIHRSTSEWEVSVLRDEGFAIDEMFDKLESKIKKNMIIKVKRLKKKFTDRSGSVAQSARKQDNVRINLTMPSQTTKPVIDEELLEDSTDSPNTVSTSNTLKGLKRILSSKTTEKSLSVQYGQPVSGQETNLSTAIPDLLTTEENTDDKETQHHIITEAFEDDDIVDNFNKEKLEEILKDKPKDIDLSLPGWGSWGDGNLKFNKRKKRRFTMKAPAQLPRRDDNKESLIINENAQTKIKDHMVSEVPFPFKRVTDFEASIRAPISNTFVPETAYRKYIEPTITTKVGAIIEPMSKNILLNKS